MLRHVPFRYILLTAELANEWSDPCMLSQMHLEIGARIIFFVATFILAMEFVNVQMSLLVVPQNPLLPEFREAPGVRAYELGALVFLMCR